MPCKINDTTGNNSQLVDLINQFFPYSEKTLGFAEPVSVSLVSSEQNAQNPLGRTAHYDPQKLEVVIYTDGRHVKDMLRSFSHELVHHNQNCQGNFGDEVCKTGPGYAQKDEHLRKMEEEAYLKGNMIFRDWEDSIKEAEIMKINEELRGVPAQTIPAGSVILINGEKATIQRLEPPDEWGEFMYWWFGSPQDPLQVPVDKKFVVLGTDPDHKLGFGGKSGGRRGRFSENKSVDTTKQGDKDMSDNEKPFKEWMAEERYNNLSEKFGFGSDLSKLKESCDKEELEEEELEEGWHGDDFDDTTNWSEREPVKSWKNPTDTRGRSPKLSAADREELKKVKPKKRGKDEDLEEGGLPSKKSVGGKEIPQPPSVKRKAAKVPKPPHMMDEEEGKLEEKIKYAKKMINFYENRNGYMNKAMAEQAKFLLQELNESKSQKGDK